MQNVHVTFETHKRLFISAFSICMAKPLIQNKLSVSCKSPGPLKLVIYEKVSLEGS